MQPVPRSMLFTPATKASRFDKAAQVGADAVILDLEDSVIAVRPGQTYSRTDSGVAGAGDSLVTTVTDKTVYVDVE